MLIGWFQKIGLTILLKKGFPPELSSDVYKAISLIPIKTHNNIRNIAAQPQVRYILSETAIEFPYRIYLYDIPDERLRILKEKQKVIIHCLFSRCCDGYVRQKHIEALLQGDCPDWAIPYIVKVCDEYVVEILELVYAKLKSQNTDRFKHFCFDNTAQFQKSYRRMTSYWNEYYRGECYRFHQYVGRKLFRECFGYTRAIEKL